MKGVLSKLLVLNDPRCLKPILYPVDLPRPSSLLNDFSIMRFILKLTAMKWQRGWVKVHCRDIFFSDAVRTFTKINICHLFKENIFRKTINYVQCINFLLVWKRVTKFSIVLCWFHIICVLYCISEWQNLIWIVLYANIKV